jgi:hypothetical protein
MPVNVTPKERSMNTTATSNPSIKKSPFAIRRIGGLLGAVVSLASVCTFALPLTRAAAVDVGGCWGSCFGTTTWSDPPGSGYSEVDCSAGRLTIKPRASVMANYTKGQYLTYRYSVTASNGYKGTSAWAAWTLAPYSRQDQSITVTTPYTPLPVTTWTVGTGLTWTVLVQFAWSTGATTSVSSAWVGPTTGYSAGGTQRWYATCQP